MLRENGKYIGFKKAVFAMHLLCNISCTDDVKCRFKNSVFALTHVIYFVL